MINVVASDACPPDRVYVSGARARLSNVVVNCEQEDDGSITVRTTADVEYDPVYQAVIRLDSK